MIEFFSSSNESSDEGDTSNSGSDNEYTGLDCDVEGFCCQSIPAVPPSSPIASSKSTHRKVVVSFVIPTFARKWSILSHSFRLSQQSSCNSYFDFQLQRTKGKSSNRPSLGTLRKTNQYHRSAIDLPTTEPCLEFYTTSDCDECVENRLCATRNPLRQTSRSDLPAKSSEKGIPDELIITSAKKHDTLAKCDLTDYRDKSNVSMVAELPAIKGPKRFNSAWSSMKR